MLQVWEVLACYLHIAEGERSLVFGPNFGCHPPIDFDYRVVGYRIEGEKAATRLQSFVDLPEQAIFVSDVMNSVCDIDDVKLLFGNFQLLAGLHHSTDRDAMGRS